MGVGKVVGAPMPGPNERVYWPIERPRNDKPVRGVVLSELIYGFDTHWIVSADGQRGRTQPCYGEASCMHKHEGAGFHWYGFVACVRQDGEIFGLLMHKSGCAELLKVAKSRGVMVGLDVRVTKTGPANWCPIKLDVLGLVSAKLPEAPSLDRSLCKLYAVDCLPVYSPLLRIAEEQA